MTTALGQGRIFRAWLPLAATWLMMSVEGPFLAAIIARMGTPTDNLAAYGVAFYFAMLLESPIIMIMSASTALVADRDSLVRLRRFTLLLNALITAAMLVFVLPPVFELVAGRLLDLPPRVAALAHRACVVLLPWPAAIGYRRFYQGVLIRAGLTRRVAYGTVVRIVSMAATALVLALVLHADGALVGAGALSAGVVMEALASRVMAAGPVRRLLRGPELAPGRTRLGWGAIVTFYYPLALTSVLALGINPLLTFFLARAQLPLESLAVMPVVNPLAFLFSSVGLAFQEISIRWHSLDPAHGPALATFARRLAAGASLAMALVAFTPLLDAWLVGASGLTPALAGIARLPVRILILMPALAVATASQRALLVVARRTRAITWATAIEVAGVVLLLALLTGPGGLVGALAAAIALVGGRAAAALFQRQTLRTAV